MKKQFLCLLAYAALVCLPSLLLLKNSSPPRESFHKRKLVKVEKGNLYIHRLQVKVVRWHDPDFCFLHTHDDQIYKLDEPGQKVWDALGKALKENDEKFLEFKLK